MNRKEFIFGTSGIALTVWAGMPFSSFRLKRNMDRIGMGTVLFRNRFQSTKPAETDIIEDELTLLNVPEYYKERFGIDKIEFWSYHFESLEMSYLTELKKAIQQAGSELINIQMDVDYDLAAENESVRLRSIEAAKEWMDAAAFLESKAIRINPGKGDGSVEKSILSMKVVNEYAKSKGLVLLTENHFGIEMDPDIHLQINKAAGPDNIYTLPDFGNYPVDSMYESLEKILPYAWMISAKAAQFNEDIEHLSFDFDKCVRMAEEAGFKGIYCVEQWSPGDMDVDYEKVADWLIAHVKENIR